MLAPFMNPEVVVRPGVAGPIRLHFRVELMVAIVLEDVLDAAILALGVAAARGAFTSRAVSADHKLQW